ncbi:MAG: hypothetical protein RBS57_13985 [Desulforhabdus sp.]|nr:hypothetical protein [Desulforhabdus sp.]
MQKHLLITISDDVRILHGVRFVGSFFANKSKLDITLLYVAPYAATSGGDRAQRDLHRKNKEIYRRKGEASLGVAKNILLERGFSAENISSKLMFKQFGTVKDIIREAHAQSYDAVVLGKRGYAVFENIMKDSVSKAIMERDIGFPIWICRRPEEDRKNVLLCVDGSEPSLRMADHVGFMLQSEIEHQVTVFHADTGEKNVEAILDAAKQKLLANGIEQERINLQVVASTGVVKTIAAEVERKAFAVVAVGRVGVKKGGLKQWLVGSRSMKLLEDLENAVLWVSK